MGGRKDFWLFVIYILFIIGGDVILFRCVIVICPGFVPQNHLMILHIRHTSVQSNLYGTPLRFHAKVYLLYKLSNSSPQLSTERILSPSKGCVLHGGPGLGLGFKHAPLRL